MSSGRKASVTSDVVAKAVDVDLPSVLAKLTTTDTLYPFSQVLRLRVLQVVCGISVLIMGAVACIADKTAVMKLGLGVPAGIFTVLAAGASIHTSRGFSGYRSSTCSPGSALRVLGPNAQIAAILTLFWSVAFSLQIALLVQCLITIQHSGKARGKETNFTVAVIQLVLSACVLVAAVMIVRIDCLHDPD
ncbi:uncharacterized protein LOC111043274 [Nilaparvata lugens]|uniref:uncharacterized protein LOC111043274 n=1 Tax=Nilaparvata lugens TaxID=108931 RepID=UPI00193EBAB9|nr:uncharacterized protein LOC111043274 [Nilaparvata lugens]